MKIEKVSDNQIKFVLTKSDLKTHNLNIADLAYGSEKTQQLFQNMMNTAFEQYDFDTNNIPIMIEAVPVSKSSIMIVITKIKNPLDVEDKFSSYMSSNAPIVSSNSTIFKNENGILSIYSFNSLDNIIDMSKKIHDKALNIPNSILKYDDKYYLIIYMTALAENINSLDYVISEYTDNIIENSKLYVSFLNEHGETIIEDEAIQKLAKV